MSDFWRAPSQSTVAWDGPRIDQLRSLWNAGKSAAEIARAMGGVSRSAILGKAHRLGLSGRATPSVPKVSKPPRPVIWTAERIETLRTMWAEGQSIHKISDAVGLTRSTVRLKVAGLGLVQRPVLEVPTLAVPTMAKKIRKVIVAQNGNIYTLTAPAPLPELRSFKPANPQPLESMTRANCHNPINDGEYPRHGWLYCADPVTDDGEYCARCRTILYDPARTAAANRRAGSMRGATARGGSRRAPRHDSAWIK